MAQDPTRNNSPQEGAQPVQAAGFGRRLLDLIVHEAVIINVYHTLAFALGKGKITILWNDQFLVNGRK